MARKRQGGVGLLPRLLLGVFIPIVLSFIVLAVMLFFNWNMEGSAQKA